MPAEAVKLEVNLPPLARGTYILEFDLVSLDVSWCSERLAGCEVTVEVS